MSQSVQASVFCVCVCRWMKAFSKRCQTKTDDLSKHTLSHTHIYLHTHIYTDIHKTQLILAAALYLIVCYNSRQSDYYLHIIIAWICWHALTLYCFMILSYSCSLDLCLCPLFTKYLISMFIK